MLSTPVVPCTVSLPLLMVAKASSCAGVKSFFTFWVPMVTLKYVTVPPSDPPLATTLYVLADRARCSALGDVFAPGPVAGEDVAGVGHPVAGVGAVGLDVIEHAGREHRDAVLACGVGEVRIDRQRLLGGGGDGAGGEPFVEVDAVTRRFRGWIRPTTVDQLDQVLLVVGRINRGQKPA